MREGDQPTRSIILVSGLACSFKIILADVSRLVILDWPRPRVFAQYDTTYLHVEGNISF